MWSCLAIVLGWSSAEAQESSRWVREGPFTLGRLSDVALLVDGSLAVIDRDGAVYLSRGSKVFEKVLPAWGSGGIVLSTDEEVLLGIEVRVEELLEEFGQEVGSSSQDSDSTETTEEPSEVGLDDVMGSASDEVQTELENDPWFLDDPNAGSAFLLRPSLAVTGAGVLYAARADGLRLWTGLRWEALSDEQITASGIHLGDLWTASSGTVTRWVDGRPAVQAELPVNHIFFLESSPSGVWAGTDQGLYQLGPLGAARIGAQVEPVVALNQSASAGFVISSVDRLWKVDEASRTWVPLPPTPFGGATSLLSAEEGLWAATQQGVWVLPALQSEWELVDAGLGKVPARSLINTDQALYAATDLGIFSFRQGRDAGDAKGWADWVPLGALVSAAAARPEFSATTGRRWAASLLPALTLEGRLQDGDAIVYVPESGTTRTLDRVWSLTATATWTPVGRRSGLVEDFAGEFDDGSELFAPDDGGDLLTLPGGSAEAGRLFVLDETSMVAGQAAVSRDAVAYLSELGQEIGVLYQARARLVNEQPAEATVREQALALIELAEIEARLDVLSDGLVSRWKTQQP